MQKENAENLGTWTGEVGGHDAAFIHYARGAARMPAYELEATVKNGDQFVRIVGSGAAGDRVRYEKLFREIVAGLSWERPE